jgi:hypothetical protein
MLSVRQARELAEIGGYLASEDPALARALSRHRLPGRAGARSRWWRLAIRVLLLVAVTATGLGLLAIGLHTGSGAPTGVGAVVVALLPLSQMLLLQRP